MRILRDITFHETEIAISMNIRSLPKEATTLITSIEIIKIIENIPNASDADIADANDINTIFENIENALFENIIIEPAPVRKYIRHRKTIFKAIRANIMIINIMRAAEAPIISADENENEEKNYNRQINYYQRE
jgi:hypothetical protein